MNERALTACAQCGTVTEGPDCPRCKIPLALAYETVSVNNYANRKIKEDKLQWWPK